MMSNTLSRLLGQSDRRAVRVRIVAGGHEVDSFEVSSSESLRSAIRPIYAHLPLLDASVQFAGLESATRTFGTSRVSRATDLPGLNAALGYLGAQPDLDLTDDAPAIARRREKVALH